MTSPLARESEGYWDNHSGVWHQVLGGSEPGMEVEGSPSSISFGPNQCLQRPMKGHMLILLFCYNTDIETTFLEGRRDMFTLQRFWETEVLAQRNQALNTDSGLSNLLNWIVLRKDSLCQRCWCNAVQETSTGEKFCPWCCLGGAIVGRCARRKPDLKTTWIQSNEHKEHTHK